MLAIWRHQSQHSLPVRQSVTSVLWGAPWGTAATPVFSPPAPNSPGTFLAALTAVSHLRQRHGIKKASIQR